MKITPARLCSVLLTSLILTGCGSDNAKPNPAATKVSAAEASLLTPTKEILVTDGDINKKYTILGAIDYKSDNSSIYADRIEGDKKAKELLKKAAFTKYGEKVDAIINAKVQTTTNGGFWKIMGAAYGSQVLTMYAEGVAVSFEQASIEPKVSAADEPTETPKTPATKSKRKTKKGH